MAGLTLALMGQDSVNLKVIEQSGEPKEKLNAKKVLSLLNKGKHWVLVTLLLGNVITNETLPIILDRCIGGGYLAVVFSTVSIVIFGEIIPQSVCVRYGLSIGATLSPFVLLLMYLMYPIAYPTALLLDYLLGEDHGTIYKRAGLKSLVNLHQSMGTALERLSEDEVTIISAVLDLKDKPVGHVMTPIKDIYTMPSDRILDESTVEDILKSGFSRIPIYFPNEPTNFIGMLLVRILISYDPEDALPIYSFPLATLPETRPDASCLNILNYFQEGKSHMIVLSETPGEPTGALGVVTLEDVIEELIGEEIIDESDVFVDVHNAIRRRQPGPLSKTKLSYYFHQLQQLDREESNNSIAVDLATGKSVTPKLGPSNPAAHPMETTIPNIKIKNLKRSSSDIVHGLPETSDTESRRKSSNYGALWNSERDTIKKATQLNLSRKTSRQAAVETGQENTETERLLTDTPVAHDASSSQIPVATDSTFIHNYRIGTIVERTKQVQGIQKHIVECRDPINSRRNSLAPIPPVMGGTGSGREIYVVTKPEPPK